MVSLSTYYPHHPLITQFPSTDFIRNSIKTLCFTLGPLFLPKAISWFNAVRVRSKTSPVPVQPIPPPISRALNILFLTALTALISTLPYFSPQNIFDITQSRIQTPNDVLFTRLAAVRGPNGLTDRDNILRPKLASMDARCLYLHYGPDVVTNCPFCISDDPITYLLYALPSIALPHLLHLFALGLATSSLVAGKFGSKWRTLAAGIGIGVAAFDIYAFMTFDWQANKRAFQPSDYILFYWRMRTVRGVGICIADAAVASLLYLSSTNRMFATPPSVAERTELALKTLENLRGNINTSGVVRNAVARDEDLRRRTEAYWIKEGKVMGEVMDERDVVEGVKAALEGRVQITKVEMDAKRIADGLVVHPSMAVPPTI